MNLKVFDGVKNRIKATPSKRTSNTETSVNYTYFCFLKYLNDLIKSNAVGGGYFE